MRYPAGHRARTREEILRAAGRVFREKGYVSTGVAEVMREAGRTVGGFYFHFPSKEALLAGALEKALKQTERLMRSDPENRQGEEWLRTAVGRYLSRAHCDAVADGCALPALAADVARSGRRVRGVFERTLRDVIETLEGKTPRRGALAARERAIATLALCAGGLMLARAVKDERFSEEILAACRRFAVAESEGSRS
jgi:TetR/AcrR family transcriptional repressor of nem operon